MRGLKSVLLPSAVRLVEFGGAVESMSMSVGPVAVAAAVELEEVPVCPSAVSAGSGPRKLSSRRSLSSSGSSVVVGC